MSKTATQPTVQRLGRASAWSAADAGGRSLLQLVVSVALARLLTPEDFGAVTIAAAFAAVAIGVLHVGFGIAVIRGTVTSDEHLSALFWWNFLIAVPAAGLMVLSGPLLASFFALPALSSLVWMAALQVVLSSIGNIQQSLLNRNLAFGAIAIAGLTSTAVSGLVAIILAWHGAGLWALAAQSVCAAGLYTALAWIFCPWRPSFQLRLEKPKAILSSIAWISSSNGLDVLYSQAFAALLGRLYGPREVGLYARAAGMQQLPTTFFATIVSRIILPVLSHCQNEPEVLRRHMGRAMALSMLMSLPVLIGLSLTADLVVALMFGDRWIAAATPMAILCIVSALHPIQLVNVQLVLALGESRLFFNQELAKKLVAFTLIIIGAQWGMIGFAWGQVAAAAIALFINVRATDRFVGYGLMAQARDLGSIFAATAIMTLFVLVLRGLLVLAPLSELVIVSSAGAVVFALSCRLLKVAALADGAQFLSPRFRFLVVGGR